jgi:uncharacterized membrane protein YphA (DoxX/SURF4 family)
MKNKIQFALSLIFGLLFIFSGAAKLFHFMPTPPDMPEKMMKLNEALTNITWLIPLIGIVEIIGGILFIIKRFRPLAAIMILPILLGVLLTHIIADPKGLPVVLVLFAIEIWVIIDNHEKYLPMIK